MSGLRVEALDKRFRDVVALSGVSLDVEAGELVVVLGPSNAGKSTLLKTIAGLHQADAGRISLGGRSIEALPPRLRRVSLLFQNNALFPTMTGQENLAFPLRTAGIAEADIRSRLKAAAELLGIGHLLGRHPRTYSGGEQQRVAIGRALLAPAELLLLDEPLSNLDAPLRMRLRLEFRRLQAETGRTMLYVTHDQVEAMSLADRIVVLNGGQVAQAGPPLDVYDRPVSRFVAELVGASPMSFLEGEVRQGSSGLELHGQDYAIALPRPADRLLLGRNIRHLALGVRPEEVLVTTVPGPEAHLAAEVVDVEHAGARRILGLRIGTSSMRAAVSRHAAHKVGDRLAIRIEPRLHRLLDPASGTFLTPLAPLAAPHSGGAAVR